MHTIRKTCKWALIIVLACGAGGAAYMYHVWSKMDRVLQTVLREKLAEIVPDWHFQIGRACLDLQGRVHLYGAQLGCEGETAALVEMPEIVLVVDRSKWTQPDPALDLIRLIQPHLHLRRDLAGIWNWQRLPSPRLSQTVPEWQFEQATVTIELERANAPSRTLTLENVSGKFIPAGKRKLKIQVSANCQLAQALTVEGELSLDPLAWNCRGEMGDLRIDPELLALLRELSPEFRAGWEGLHRQMTASLPEVTQRDATASTAAVTRVGLNASTEPSRIQSPTPVIAPPDPFVLTAVADAVFTFRREVGAASDAAVSLRFRRGELSAAGIAFPLFDLTGSLTYGGGRLQFDDLRAKNGGAVLKLSGGAATGSGGEGKLVLDVENLVLDDRLRALIPPPALDLYNALHCSGVIDVHCQLSRETGAEWTHESRVTARNCKACFAKFPYPVEQVEGTLEHVGDYLNIAFRGLAGDQPVTVTGRVHRPGPLAEVVVDVRVSGLPVDDKLRAACTSRGRQALDMLQLQGTVDAVVRIVRPAGPDPRYIPALRAQLKQCGLTCKAFPYPLSQVRGTVEAQGDVWTFYDCTASHEGAQFTGQGSLVPGGDGRAHIELKFQGRDVPFEPTLQAALPEQWQTVYKEFSPNGRLHVSGDLQWDEGQPPRVRMDGELVSASIAMRSFPYPQDEVQAQLSLGAGKLQIHSWTGRHDETRIRLNGNGEFLPDGEWRVRLEQLSVDDLVPDRRFRKSLPERLRDVVEALDPRGKMSVAGMLEFRGTGRTGDDVTAAWDLETVYSGTSVTAGIDLENMHGRVALRGTWDGERVVGNGRIDLDSLSVRGYQLTKIQGPLSVNGTQLVIGSKEAVNGTDPGRSVPMADNSRRLTAKFIDGVLALDGIAVLEPPTSYHVRMTLGGGRLERFAQLYLPGRDKLMGVMNGWIDLYGRGPSAQRLSGRGQLLVSPAALYELPVVVAIFKILSFVPPDKTAFKNGLVDFDVGSGQFKFRRIDLVGDAMNLRGYGFVRFDGPLSLDFYSSIPRNQLPIPIVKELIGEATRGWVGVQVRGTMSNPVATVRAVPQMDDALRGFLGVFDGRGHGPQAPVAGPRDRRPPFR